MPMSMVWKVEEEGAGPRRAQGWEKFPENCALLSGSRYTTNICVTSLPAWLTPG